MLRVAIQIGILCALIGVATALTYFYHPNRPSLYLTAEKPVEGEISIDEALKIQAADGVIWIDARQRPQYDKEHVPGALLLNEQEFNDLIVNVIEPINEFSQRKIVVYCDAKKCDASKAIAQRLREITNDPERIRVLHGGFAAWQNAKK